MLIQNVALSEMFSWRSPSFKAMGLSQDTLTSDDLIRLMIEEPRLIRRPMTKIGDAIVVGSSQTALDQALKGC